MKSNNPEASLKKSPSHSDPAPEGTRGSKSNGPEATLRSGNLPKGEAVRSAKYDEGAAVRCATKQNISDGGTDPKKRNVIPNKDDESLIVTAVAKVKE